MQDSDFKKKAQCIRALLFILISENLTSKVLDFIGSKAEFTVTKTDIAMELKVIPSPKIYTTLVSSGILIESDQYGTASNTNKKGRAAKKYYKVNKENLKIIEDFVNSFSGCKS